MAARHTGGGKPPRQPSKRKRNPFLRFLKWFLTLIVVGIIAGLGLFAWYAKDAPQLSQAKLRSDGSSIIYDGSGNEITSLGLETRSYVNSDQISQQLADAVVSIEDRRFYQEHFGIDPMRIASAAVNDVLRRGGLQGGSTLTQQLVKLSFFSTRASDQTLKRKAQEAWLALKVEQRFSKQQILEYYVNKVYMNYGQYGMGTAAHYYFGKDLRHLSLAQTAFIAGLAQSPVGYDPYKAPQKATDRRNLVIDAMLRDKKISAAAAAQAKATPISSGLINHSSKEKADSENSRVVDSYLTQVIKDVKAKTGLNPYTAGLKIYTNLDMKAQKRLYDIVNGSNYVSFPDNKLQTAVTMTNPKNGRVVAQIGGRKTGDVKLAYNRAVATSRSNGSNMKPLLDYGPAIEYLNQSTYTQIDDSPYQYPGTNTSVYDWDRQYKGVISMRQALAGSRNIPAIKTLDTVGINKGLNFLKGLGITLPANQHVISSAIGGSVSTEESASAYGAFANGGTYYKPNYIRKITTQDGVTTSYDSAGSRAMKSSTAYMITDMLKDVFTSSEGTGHQAAVSGLYEAGKSGSVNYSDEDLAANPALSGAEKDSWFTGYTKQRVISVWTGYDKAQQNGLSGSNQFISQQIYKALMSYVSADLNNTNWKKPSSVIARNIVIGSNPPQSLPEAVSGKTTRELFVAGTTANVTMGSFTASSSASGTTANTVSADTSSSDAETSSESSSESGSTSSSSASSESSASSNATPSEPAASSSSQQQESR
ncbi:PBP1A family penicillin-binding protein [Lacticaseibacillus pabuli]|uniref:PBP1A family penicillin-binding protein n=1 Tax=Lacticaseibacillus pabuli TaxID=3025672 RepID=UPI00300F9576